jgi:hypothetical protein
LRLGPDLTRIGSPSHEPHLDVMFTIVKIRADQKPGDYRDPGWFKHPAGSLAFEWQGELPAATRIDGAGGQSTR